MDEDDEFFETALMIKANLIYDFFERFVVDGIEFRFGVDS